MRIAFVSLMGGSPWAASEALWAEAATLALQQGHSVLISAFEWPDKPPVMANLEAAGAQLDLRPLSRWYRRSSLLTFLAGSFGSLRRFRPDVICINQGGTYDVARGGHTVVLRRSLRRLGIPYIVLCHCEQPAPPERNVRAAREVFAGASVVGMVSDNLRAVSETHLGVALPNVRAFHNPVNLRRIERLPWPDAGSTLKFAFVGRLDPVKNLGSLLTALAQPPWLTRDWLLTVFGAGPDRNALERQVAESQLAARVRFAGFVNDIEGIWAEHHLLVMPSRFEGVPLAMIEAMLCGRPVVATNIGGISQWLEDGRCGQLIQRPEPCEIAAALEKIWQRRDELESMGRYAQERTLRQRDPTPARTLVRWLADSAAKGRATDTAERSAAVADDGKVVSAANR